MDDDRTTAAAPDSATSGPLVERRSWRALLAEEDRRCDDHGIQAGVLTVDFGVAVPHGSPRLRQVLQAELAPTDRAAFVSASEMQILVTPLSDANELERRAASLDSELHSEGLAAGVGWAPRRSAGFVDACARADAAAAARRPREPVIDVRDDA